MLVVRLLLGDRGLPHGLAAALAVVVADEQARPVGERQDRLDRAVEDARVAAREVRARGAAVRMHERVVDEGRVVADHEGDRAQRMARREHDAHRQAADLEPVAVRQQPVERALDVEGLGQVVEGAPEQGDLAHSRADRGRRAELLLEVGRGHQVVGMGMGVEDPGHLEPLVRDVGQDLVGGRRAGAGRPGVEVPDDVDQRGLPRRPVAHDVLDAAGIGLVEADDLGRARAARRAPAHPDHRASPLRRSGDCVDPPPGAKTRAVEEHAGRDWPAGRRGWRTPLRTGFCNEARRGRVP